MIEVALVLVVISVLACAHFVQVCAIELRQIRGFLEQQNET